MTEKEHTLKELQALAQSKGIKYTGLRKSALKAKLTRHKVAWRKSSKKSPNIYSLEHLKKLAKQNDVSFKGDIRKSALKAKLTRKGVKYPIKPKKSKSKSKRKSPKKSKSKSKRKSPKKSKSKSKRKSSKKSPSIYSLSHLKKLAKQNDVCFKADIKKSALKTKLTKAGIRYPIKPKKSKSPKKSNRKSPKKSKRKIPNRSFGNIPLSKQGTNYPIVPFTY